MSKSHDRNDNHYYYVPRISIDEFLNISDNIAISSACLGGVLASNDEETKEKYLNYFMKNKHRCFLEIQHHQVESQCDYNRHLYDLHKQTGLNLIIGTDTHALNKEHLDGRKILQKAKNIFFENEEGWDLSLKTYDELINIYKNHNYIPLEEIKEALENTNRLADMVEDYEFDYTPKYPKLYDSSIKVFKEKIFEGIQKRGIDKLSNYEDYKKRINEEYKVYKQLNAIDYMLLQTKILDDAKEKGIQWGYGRGSVNGSIIAYLLGITECDSLKFNLNFFRFLNPSRQSMPDIDVDYCKKDRDWVKEHLFHIEGIYAADIITFNTIADKGAIRDVGRALEIPLNEVSYICENFEIKEEELRKKYVELFRYVDIIKGTIVSIGTHPSGTIVSPIPLDKYMGLCSLSTTEHPVSMLQMKEVDKFCFVKLDILGLDNIGVINETCKLANINRLTPDTIDYNDDKVYQSIKEDTTTVFQMESNMAKQYLDKILSDDTLKKLKQRYPNIRKFDILKFTNGAIRPSGESFRDKASMGICGDNGLRELDDMLYDSLGYCLVQEQIMMFLVNFCGYSMAESDTVRRAIAKKGGTEQYIPEITRRFIEYSTSNFDITTEKAKEIIIPFTDVIISAQNYGFSENHNFPYTTTSYICGYLRYYYPLEYLTVCLNTWADDEDKTNRIVAYTEKIGIHISSIKFRHSKGEYTCDKNTNSIYKGIGSIKFLNTQIGEDLYTLRSNKYNMFTDLLIDLTENFSINTKQIKILIQLKFFSEFGGNKKLLNIFELFQKRYKKTHKEKTKSERIKEIQEFEIQLENKNLSAREQLLAEYEYLGYAVSKYAKFKDKALIINIDVSYSPKIKLYKIDTGEEVTYKVYKNTYKKNPLNQYDVIEIGTLGLKNKSKNINGEWVKTEDKEVWMEGYKKLNKN